MTSSSTLNEDYAPGLGRTLFFTFPSRGITFFNSGQLCPDVLVIKVKKLLLSGYVGVQNAVHYVAHTTRGQGVTTTDESFHLESQPDSDQQLTDTSQEPGESEDTPPNLLRNHNKPSTSEAEDLEVEADQPAPREEHSSHEDHIERSKRTWTWMAALIAGVLSLIVLPGLVVGFVTRQMSWGIELSGAVAPIVIFLAGLYYRCNK